MTDDLNLLLLTPAEMAKADLLAARSGIDSFGLMERAGQAVAAAALRHFPAAPRFVVLCGPGNNGGDGYVAARALRASGCDVDLYHFGDPEQMKGDAARARTEAAAASRPVADWIPQPGDVVVDALFGAGLSKELAPQLQELITGVNGLGLDILAVDLPSGLDGRTGTVRGAAFRATHTVTFMTRKPGHVLLPGRTLCGSIEIFDIGIPQRILRQCAGRLRVNHPGLWRLPIQGAETHKFERGHLGVFSGPASATGAARLSAMAGLHAGAGLVTVAAEPSALAALESHLTAVMIREIADRHALASWISDRRLSAFVLGPGFGTGRRTRDYVEMLAGRPLVLDADAITAYRDQPGLLFSLFEDASEPSLVLTPHEGEFARLFPEIAGDSRLGKIERAQAAADLARAVIVYKGADTVIAAPGGPAYVNENAPPWLATAGSGDVLAGTIGALLAQGMPAFQAAAAGVYLHGEAGRRAGAGLTAEDLPQHLSAAMRAIA